MKKILVLSATQMEIQPFLNFLQQQAKLKHNLLFGQNGYEFDVVVSGVGMVNTAYQLGKSFAKKQYHTALNVGIAGSYDRRILRGEVVEIISEQYGDLGVEELDGSFTDVFEMDLVDGTKKPFVKGKLLNIKPLSYKNLKQVKGLTVNKVHGNRESIELTYKKYKPEVETMESAAFFQACLTEGVPFVAIRAISNYVEPRNKDNWKMKEAIENLNNVMIELFEQRVI
jgi:futalosine hydrolase